MQVGIVPSNEPSVIYLEKGLLYHSPIYRTRKFAIIHIVCCCLKCYLIHFANVLVNVEVTTIGTVNILFISLMQSQGSHFSREIPIRTRYDVVCQYQSNRGQGPLKRVIVTTVVVTCISVTAISISTS